MPERAGRITRTRDEHDRRSFIVAVVSRDSDAHEDDAEHDPHRVVNGKILACLTHEERAQLSGLRGKVVTALELEAPAGRHGRGGQGRGQHGSGIHGRGMGGGFLDADIAVIRKAVEDKLYMNLNIARAARPYPNTGGSMVFTARIDEVAMTYVFLMANSFITGQTIAVDGGVDLV